MTVLNQNINLSCVVQDGAASDHEILNSIFSNVLQGTEKKITINALLNRFGGISAIMSASDETLEEMAGLPADAIDELLRTRKLMQSILRSEISGRPLIDNLDSVRRFSRAMLASKTREEFHAIFLDESFFLIGHECLQVGTINHVTVYPRELMWRALTQNARHVILVHNHPGGSEHPSEADIQMTNKLIKSGELLNVSILDHIIIGRTSDFSFRMNGLLISE